MVELRGSGDDDSSGEVGERKSTGKKIWGVKPEKLFFLWYYFYFAVTKSKDLFIQFIFKCIFNNVEHV